MNSCEQRVCSKFLCRKMDPRRNSGDPTPGDTSKLWVPISRQGDLASAALCHCPRTGCELRVGPYLPAQSRALICFYTETGPALVRCPSPAPPAQPRSGCSGQPQGFPQLQLCHFSWTGAARPRPPPLDTSSSPRT